MARWLQPVVERAEIEFPPVDELDAPVDSASAYTTWAHIAECVQVSLQEFEAPDPSVRGSNSRLAEALLGALRWHCRVSVC